jgi:hypothetical protein
VHFLPAELEKRCEFIERESENYPVKVLCEAVSVSRDFYYRYLNRNRKNQEEEGLADVVRRIFWRPASPLWFSQDYG